MDLFKTTDKYQKESEESVEVYNKLKKHEATFPEVQKTYDAGRDEVVRLIREYNGLFQAEGHSERSRAKAEELRLAKHKRDDPKQSYESSKNNLQNELESLVHPFINEKLEEWEAEEVKIKAQKVDREVRREKDEPGTFSLHMTHRIERNLKAIRFFRERSMENRLHIRDMAHYSIPLIQEFIDEASAEMQAIDLTPVIIEMNDKEYDQWRRDSVKDPPRWETEVRVTNEKNDNLVTAYEDAKRVFKPRP